MNTPTMFQPKPKKPFHSTLLFRIILIFIVLMIAFILVATVRGYFMKKDVTSKSEIALESKGDAIAAEQQKRLELFKMQVKTDGDAIHTAQYKSCYTDHNDSGWIAESYNYRCNVYYVSVYELKSQPKELEDMSFFIPPSSRSSQNKSPFVAASIEDLNTDPDQEIYAEYESRYYLKPSGTAASIKDIDDDPSVITSGATIAYAVTDAHKNRKLLSTATTGGFQVDKNYVIHSWGKSYFSKNIGCSIISPLYCISPM